MATYSRSPRLIAAYKTCRGLYCGFGPVWKIPKRLKVAAYFSKVERPWRMNMMLTIVDY